MDSDQPWIDPELVAAQALLKARGLVAVSPMTSPLADARAALDRISAFLNEGSRPLQRERDLAPSGPHGPMPCRLYLPDGTDTPPPLLIYAHGGSYVVGNVTGWDGAMRALVRDSGAAVLSVDYRLAPEHRFPVASDEMIATIRIMAQNGAKYGIDPGRIAAGGDSAGANLALGAALTLRDEEIPLRFLLLNYGAYSTDGNSPSWRRFGMGNYGLSQAQLDWMWNIYLTSEHQKADPRVAPLSARLDGLPSTVLTVGSLDPLQDDNHRLAERLKAVGVPCTLLTYEGLAHGFIRYGRLISAVRRAISDTAAALRHAMMQQVH